MEKEYVVYHVCKPTNETDEIVLAINVSASSKKSALIKAKKSSEWEFVTAYHTTTAPRNFYGFIDVTNTYYDEKNN